MKKIVYTRPDGGLSVVHPAWHLRAEGYSEDAFVEAIIGKDVPADATNVTVVDEVPSDRTFRNAWTLASGEVVHDMEKAREIQREMLREIRAPLLASLDVDYLRAVETGNLTLQADIVAEKQALRDVTADPSIAAATTPEQLKLAIPDVLK